MQKGDQVRHPNARREALAGNVAEDDAEDAVELEHLEKITGQVAHRKNLAGDFKVAAAEFARGAQTALHLRSFKEDAVYGGLLSTQFGEFGLQISYALRFGG